MKRLLLALAICAIWTIVDRPAMADDYWSANSVTIQHTYQATPSPSAHGSIIGHSLTSNQLLVEAHSGSSNGNDSGYSAINDRRAAREYVKHGNPDPLEWAIVFDMEAGVMCSVMMGPGTAFGRARSRSRNEDFGELDTEALAEASLGGQGMYSPTDQKQVYLTDEITVTTEVNCRITSSTTATSSGNMSMSSANASTWARFTTPSL